MKYRTLYTAVQKGDAEDVKKHLLRGEKVNEINATYNWTPLHRAVSGGHAEIVRLLLDHGADPSLRDKWDKTPLDHALEEGHEEIAELLRSHGA